MMPKDNRLLWSIVFFAGAMCAGLYQGMVVKRYIEAAVLGHLRFFARTFGQPVPPAFCFDFCVPELPFAAGWLALASFLSGLCLVVRAWWKPRR
jgi:hypothetical protein